MKNSALIAGMSAIVLVLGLLKAVAAACTVDCNSGRCANPGADCTRTDGSPGKCKSPDNPSQPGCSCL